MPQKKSNEPTYKRESILKKYALKKQGTDKNISAKENQIFCIFANTNKSKYKTSKKMLIHFIV